MLTNLSVPQCPIFRPIFKLFYNKLYTKEKKKKRGNISENGSDCLTKSLYSSPKPFTTTCTKVREHLTIIHYNKRANILVRTFYSFILFIDIPQCHKKCCVYNVFSHRGS